MKKPIKTALITGAGSGIGLATAKALSELGTITYLLGRDEKKLLQAQSQLKSKSEILICDLSSLEDIQKTAELLKQKNVHFDLLVNNAGIFSFQSFVSTSDDEWIRQWNTNFLGPVRLTRALLPLLNDGSSIINVGSTLGGITVANTSHYSSTKAAIHNWTQGLALELAPKIRVNCISPGIIQTQMNPGDMHSAQPMQRMGQPEDIAEAIVFMAQSEWMTGSIVPLDGGISIL